MPKGWNSIPGPLQIRSHTESDLKARAIARDFKIKSACFCRAHPMGKLMELNVQRPKEKKNTTWPSHSRVLPL